MLRLIHVPELQEIAVVQVGDALGAGLDQDARGARVADVQHQVHVNGVTAEALRISAVSACPA